MKKLLFVVLVMLLAGCTPSAKELNFPVMPEELADCKVFRLSNSSGNIITVARCPNSVTTTKSGKAPAVIVIDGVEYAPVKK